MQCNKVCILSVLVLYQQITELCQMHMHTVLQAMVKTINHVSNNSSYKTYAK